MGWFGPKTGAGDGGKEFKAQCLHRGTGSHWKAEEKKHKQNARKEARKEKRDEKVRNSEKKPFFY